MQIIKATRLDRRVRDHKDTVTYKTSLHNGVVFLAFASGYSIGTAAAATVAATISVTRNRAFSFWDGLMPSFTWVFWLAGAALLTQATGSGHPCKYVLAFEVINAAHEVSFIQTWIGVLRGSSDSN